MEVKQRAKSFLRFQWIQFTLLKFSLSDIFLLFRLILQAIFQLLPSWDGDDYFDLLIQIQIQISDLKIYWSENPEVWSTHDMASVSSSFQKLEIAFQTKNCNQPLKPPHSLLFLLVPHHFLMNCVCTLILNENGSFSLFICSSFLFCADRFGKTTEASSSAMAMACEWCTLQSKWYASLFSSRWIYSSHHLTQPMPHNRSVEIQLVVI